MDPYDPTEHRRQQIAHLRARAQGLRSPATQEPVDRLLKRLDYADRLLGDIRVNEIPRHRRVDEELGEIETALVHLEHQ